MVQLIIVQQTDSSEKICSDNKNLDNQTRSFRLKSMNSEAVLQAIEANPVSITWRVSGELDISQSSVVRHDHVLGKSIQSCWIAPHLLPKYCKTFDSLK